MKAAALATVPEVRAKVDAEAVELASRWFAEHREGIRQLPDIRQQDYEDIRAMATEPQAGTLGRPRTRIEDFQFEDGDQIALAPLVQLHLMADEAHDFPIGSLNEWERVVVTNEIKRAGCRGWYRNPSRIALDALTIAYRDQKGDWRAMHPDFVFFHEHGDQVRASIVDPHGHHLPDARIKLKALGIFRGTTATASLGSKPSPDRSVDAGAQPAGREGQRNRHTRDRDGT